jgi:hypothetical protein
MTISHTENPGHKHERMLVQPAWRDRFQPSHNRREVSVMLDLPGRRFPGDNPRNTEGSKTAAEPTASAGDGVSMATGRPARRLRTTYIDRRVPDRHVMHPALRGGAGIRSLPIGGYSACSDIHGHRSTRKPGPGLGDPRMSGSEREGAVRAEQKPDRPDPAKGYRRPGRSTKLLASGYRHVGAPPPRPRAAGPGTGLAPRGGESRTARVTGRKALFAKRGPDDDRPVAAVAVTPGDCR